MSHVVVTLVMQCFRGESGRKRDVALAIADSCPDHTGERMYKAIENIAHSADVARSTAEAAISYFVKVGWLIKVRQGGQGPRSTSEYKINPVWMELASEEIACAMQERRRTRRVPIQMLQIDDVAKDDKHPSLGCLSDGLSTRVLGSKDPNLSPKHPSYSGTNSERIEHNTPLPPVGGESVFEKIAKAFPRQDVADMTAAKRELVALQRKGFDPAEHLEPMLTAIHRERMGRQWQQDGGRFVPSLSKWLRGYGNGGVVLAVQGEAADASPMSAGWDASRERTEAAAMACGVGTFEAAQLSHYQRKGCPLMWAGYVQMVRDAMAARVAA